MARVAYLLSFASSPRSFSPQLAFAAFFVFALGDLTSCTASTDDAVNDLASSQSLNAKQSAALLAKYASLGGESGILGRPTNWRVEPNMGFCPAGTVRIGADLIGSALIDCRYYVSSPQMATGTSPEGMTFTYASFEHGQLYAYDCGGDKPCAFEVADDAGAHFASAYLGIDPGRAGTNSFLGIPSSGMASENGTPIQRFRNKCSFAFNEHGPSFDCACEFELRADGTESGDVAVRRIVGDDATCPVVATFQRIPEPLVRRASLIAGRLQGYELTDAERQTLRYIAWRVVPWLTRYYGDRREAIRVAALVAWWALRENTWDLSLVRNVVAYSNCGGRQINAEVPCSDRVQYWQVGIAALQAGNGAEQFEALLAGVLAKFDARSETELRRGAAAEAGFGPGTKELEAALSWAGRGRRAWLFRHPVLAFAAQVGAVTNYCFDGSVNTSGCFGANFAANSAAAKNVIKDLETTFDELAPTF